MSDAKTNCGRAGCILFYTSEDCLLCTTALTQLHQTLEELRIPCESVYLLDVDEKADREMAIGAGLQFTPTTNVCGRLIVGLPDEGSLRDALLRAMLEDCFWST